MKYCMPDAHPLAQVQHSPKKISNPPPIPEDIRKHPAHFQDISRVLKRNNNEKDRILKNKN